VRRARRISAPSLEGIDKIYLADILARVYKHEARNDVERWSAKEDQRGTV
jgi:hypothetical protein